ncbi:MAG: hypothetical protein WKF43_16755, partial [Acidimicrobiales bacterium]
MHVDVGPASAESAAAFVDYAGNVIDKGGGDLPPDVVDAFRGYLSEWRTLAEKGAAFHWDTDVPADIAEYLVLAFFRLAQRLQETAETYGRAAPPEAEEFYRLLVAALLDGLIDESQASAEFAEHLRAC